MVYGFIANKATELRSEVTLAAQFIIPRNVGKNSQILQNPLKFAFCEHIQV